MTGEPIAPGGNGAKKWVPIIALILNAVTTLLVPAFLWMATEIIDLRKWQAATEANRFTAGDATKVYQEIALIHQEIAKLPKETPPTWFLDQFRQVQTKLDRMDGRLHVIEQKVK